MKRIVAVSWKAHDGSVHDTKEKADAHEQKQGFKLLENMTAADVRNLISGKDEKRREMATRLYYAIRDARLAAGDVKHRKPKGEAAVTPPQPSADDASHGDPSAPAPAAPANEDTQQREAA